MRKFYPFEVNDIDKFKLQLLELAAVVSHFCYLDANNYPNYPYSTFGSFFAIDAIAVFTENSTALESFERFKQQHQDWMFGFLNYDLKDEIEPNTFIKNKNKIDGIKNPPLHFFVPKYLIKIENNIAEIGVINEVDIENFRLLLQRNSLSKFKINHTQNLQHRIKKNEYLEIIHQIKQHIQQGDIYEMNFCQEFYEKNSSINPIHVFNKLNELSKAPFTSFFKNEQSYLMCASPERFLKRQQNKLISQPIKGTRKRSADKKQDNFIKQSLFFDEKERSENIMIVDLVRNDFSKIALKNSVEVEELFGIYSFEQVHQLISTISCSIPENLSFSDIIKALFPMGSMTGAPKIAAMQFIDFFEKNKRGLFSGAVGYITPKGNFDFNVVIRSILYDDSKKYISIQTGSAITIDSNAEQEYEECLLKANAMFLALQ